MAQQRLLFTLLAVFAGLAVCSRTVGIYGVVASFVGQRSTEIGVRVALGARRDEIARLVMRQSLPPVAVGLAARHWPRRWRSAGSSRTLLFDVSALDPAMFAAAALALAAVATLACAVPARRASRLSPVEALRRELTTMLATTAARARALSDHAGMDRELDAEVRFHIEMETQKYMPQGMTAGGGAGAAMRNFGPMEKHKEEARDARGVSWLEELVKDLQLRRAHS